MKIRDSFARLNGDIKITTLPSGGLDIVADDGQTIFSLRLEKNILLISSGNICKHEGKILDDIFLIKPRAANCVDLVKPEYISK